MRSMNTKVTVEQLNLLRQKTAEESQIKNMKVRVSLSIRKDLLERIDEMKGLASRSAFVEKMLRDQLNREKAVATNQGDSEYPGRWG